MKEIIKEIILSSFNKMCEFDYAQKFTENEEDERAAIYRYIRNDMITNNLDNNLRVFLSYTFRVGSEILKPDILIVSHEEGFNNLKTEAIIEIKNWPKKAHIIKDINKLIQYRDKLSPEQPDLYFLGVVGYDKGSNDLDSYSKSIQDATTHDVTIALRLHDDLYEGPWCSETNTDPWRAKYRK